MPIPVVIAMVGAITDKKKAEEALLRYTAIVESSDDAIISKDLDAIITSWNAAAQRIFGYKEEETVGQPITILIPPDLWDEENKILAKLRTGERIDHYETIRVTKTGKKVNVSLTISPIRDASDKIVGYSKIARDISDRKRAELELAKANERLCLAFEAGSAGGWDWDIKTGKNQWFGNSHAQLGMSPEETSGSREEFWDHVHEDDRENLRSAMAAAREKHGQFNEEFRVVWRDGTIHWLRSRGRYYYSTNGEPERMLGISSDITERKRDEEALLSSEQRYRLLFERNVAGVGIGSPDGRLLGCNDGWARILGYESRDEVVGRHALEFYFNPADRQPLLDELRERAVFSRELQLKRKDGTPVWVLFNAATLNSEHNIPVVQCTMIDISESKQAEEALAGMTRKLVEAQEQERARIARELHDDINQRLALVSVELGRLWDSRSEAHSDVQDLRKELSQISADVHSIAHDLHSSNMQYLGAIAGMKSWCRQIAERHKIEIAFTSHFSGNLPPAAGLPLFRVLQEAVNNAIKYSGEKRIEVQLRGHSGEIHLIISDSGTGFDVASALRGKGLGLTSMRERVRLVNGTIAIESRPMGGTNIHVRIPLEGRSNVERLSA